MNITAKQHAFLEDFGAKLETQERVAFSANDIVTAELKGYDIGYEAGYADAKESVEANFMISIETKTTELFTVASRHLAQLDEIINELSQLAVHLATVFSKTLARSLVNKFPNDVIEHLAKECFRHMRDTPHFVFRVTPDMVEILQSRLQNYADGCGFTGRIIILGDPELLTGDVRIEWANGGYEHSQKAIEDEIDEYTQKWVDEHTHTIAKDA